MLLASQGVLLLYYLCDNFFFLSSVQGDQHFKITVDQVIVNDHITSPVAALGYAFALYYVCNIQYPKEISLTLEFIQR